MKNLSKILFLLCITGMALPGDFNIPAFSMHHPNSHTTELSLSLQILLAMTLLSVLPALLMLMTSFTRIIIVLSVLRQAIGMPQTPTNQILVGIALFLSLYIMYPVMEVSYQKGIAPYYEKKITYQQATQEALSPFKKFMLKQTRIDDLVLFSSMAHQKKVKKEELPIHIVIPAFITSELKTAFQMGFMIFIPFLVIDLVVASVLMAMGMMMLSPLVISLPFKIMLFVLVDGWDLLLNSLVNSFGVV